jgi:hypothetical protein
VRKLVCTGVSGAVCVDLEVRTAHERLRHMGVRAAPVRGRRMRSQAGDGM